MLDGLDDINWSRLTHAYEEASDVPELLRNLLSDDPQDAIQELFGNIWHQGTVYPATAAAVPFLYEALTAPAAGRSAIAHLLSCIVDGRGYLEVHAVGDFRKSTRRRLGEKGMCLEDELARERAQVDAVRRAISAGLPLLMPFLRDEEPEIRRSVAVALGIYPEHSAVSRPALENALAGETDEEVQEAIEESLLQLSEGQ